MSDVPESVECLVDAAGVDTVLAFLEAFGGTRMYVPKRADTSQLTQMYGDELAGAICSYFGPGYWDVPMHKAWRVLCYRNAGMTVGEMATRTGLSERQIYATLKRARETGTRVCAPRARCRVDERQISLF
ncbi:MULTISPECIES: hypothetical protein [Acetobacter]|uniref:Mor transcription activator domain-containing protein n=1 Tax=Acetobacter lovaniensis TaxID=104100 RepID=A0A841QGY9_9PROT|nr:hypothetical protein [Acetobacter lovaniensis]MBB6457443.1 hypothetical protein [Acetobacter lovaniensis]NHN81741.1 hypothetical protein [Acetobacter lovaniensis]GBQ70840.1 hypothetical protein AA0474_2289 [Acetobacter lovaniensis NRIC 0474]